jgi:ABC-type cobalamin transport system permease subunit
MSYRKTLTAAAVLGAIALVLAGMIAGTALAPTGDGPAPAAPTSQPGAPVEPAGVSR